MLADAGVRLLSIQTSNLAVRGAKGKATKTCRYATAFERTETGVRYMARGVHTWTLEKQAPGWRVSSVSWRPDPPERGRRRKL